MKPIIIYNRLYKHFGPQHWWPVSSKKGDCCFEICVGAILTQSTNWKNVELALNNLKKEEALTACAIAECGSLQLQRLIRPSGYYRQKAKKLKVFSGYICENYGGSVKNLLKGDLSDKRKELLSIWGIGPETADSILLYAGGKPTFVIDAYTRRLCCELGIKFDNYEGYREYFQKTVKPEYKIYNEFHALIVAWGKLYAKDKAAALKIIKIKKPVR